jgi:hypothetical protein
MKSTRFAFFLLASLSCRPPANTVLEPVAEPIPSAAPPLAHAPLRQASSAAPKPQASAAAELPPPIGQSEPCVEVPARPFQALTKACNDHVQVPLNCRSLRAKAVGSEACTEDLAARACEGMAEVFKPRIAHLYFQCLLAHNKPGVLCTKDACAIDACRREALEGACLDPATEVPCDEIAKGCSGVDKAECAAYLSGMRLARRSEVVQCLKNRCASGFLGCLPRGAVDPPM